jgi:hypothetical protein
MKHQDNPRHLRYAYLSFLLIQTFDCYLFTSLSTLIFPDRTILTGPTQFFIRANAVSLFPYIVLIFLLRDVPVSTPIGRAVALSFTLLHGLALVFNSWHGGYGPWSFDPAAFWSAVFVHGMWFASGTAALMGH